MPLCPDLNYPFQKYNINYYLMRFLNEFRFRSGWLSNQTLLPGYTSTSLKHTGEIRHTSIASARVAESECGLLRQFCVRNCGKIAREKMRKIPRHGKKIKTTIQKLPRLYYSWFIPLPFYKPPPNANQKHAQKHPSDRIITN